MSGEGSRKCFKTGLKIRNWRMRKNDDLLKVSKTILYTRLRLLKWSCYSTVYHSLAIKNLLPVTQCTGFYTIKFMCGRILLKLLYECSVYGSINGAFIYEFQSLICESLIRSSIYEQQKNCVYNLKIFYCAKSFARGFFEN